MWALSCAPAAILAAPASAAVQDSVLGAWLFDSDDGSQVEDISGTSATPWQWGRRRPPMARSDRRSNPTAADLRRRTTTVSSRRPSRSWRGSTSRFTESEANPRPLSEIRAAQLSRPRMGARAKMPAERHLYTVCRRAIERYDIGVRLADGPLPACSVRLLSR